MCRVEVRGGEVRASNPGGTSRVLWAKSESPSSCHHGRRRRAHRGLRSSRGGVREVRRPSHKAFFGTYPIFHAASFLPSCAEYRLTVSLPFTYRSYEDYLDSQISEIDLYYLDDVQACRQLVELGHRGNGEIVKRAEFNARKEASEIAKQQRANKKPKKLASAGKDLDAFPLLKVRCRPFALACLPAVPHVFLSHPTP